MIINIINIVVIFLKVGFWIIYIYKLIISNYLYEIYFKELMKIVYYEYYISLYIYIC